MHNSEKQRFLNAIADIKDNENPNREDLETAVSYCDALIRNNPGDAEICTLREKILSKIDKLNV